MKTLYTLISLAIILILFPQNAFSSENDNIKDADDGHVVPIDANCDNLHRKLLKCEEYRCVSEKPDGSITGVYIRPYDEQLKTCTHQQSTETDAIITCKYDDETRKFVANMLQKQSQGYKPTDVEQDLMDEVYKTHCTNGEFNFKFPETTN